MKTVIVALNAKYIHTNPAVRYLTHYAKKHNETLDITIYESTINTRTEVTEHEIYRMKPDILAFSCYIWNIEIVLRLCNVLKKILPEMKIILGGPEVSYTAADIMHEHDYIDFIISGEGEKPFSCLLNALQNDTDFADIHGISYRAENGNIVQNELPEPLDLAELPFAYKNELDTLKNRIIYYEASRGCPFRCSYCLSSAEKNGVRFAPIEKVKSELSELIAHNVPQVKFVDRTFNCSDKFAEEIIQHIMDNDNGITNFHFEIEAFVLSDKIADLLITARKGLFQLEIGVQSTNSDTLNAVNRKGEFSKIRDTVKKLMRNQNMHIHLDQIAGLPHEDYSSFRKSYNDVFSLEPDKLQLGFLKMLKGSGIRNDRANFGMVYSPYAPYEILCTDCLSYDDVLMLKGVEDTTEIYYNSGRFKNSLQYTMQMLIQKFGTPFDFFEALAKFRQENYSSSYGAEGKHEPYKILLNFFAVHSENSDNTKLRYYIRYDMLLHEKTNYMPDWLGIDYDTSYSEQAVRKLYRDGIIELLVAECKDLQTRQLSKVLHIEKFPFNPLTNEDMPVELLFYYAPRQDTRIIVR